MNWLQKFMYGRYGTDQLSITLGITAVILAIITPFVHFVGLTILTTLLILVSYMRILSKNYAKRRVENEKFLKIYQPLKYQVQKRIKRLRDSKTHKYFSCPNCHKTVRVPRGKGKIAITCPICREEFIRKS